MFYNERGFRKAAQISEVPEKTSTEPLSFKTDGLGSQSQRLKTVHEFFNARHDEVLHRRGSQSIPKNGIHQTKDSFEAGKQIEAMVFEEAILQLPGANETKLKQLIHAQLQNYPNPKARKEFIDGLPKELKLKANQYLASQSSPSGYQQTALPLVVGAYEAALFITGLALVGVNCYKDWRSNNPGFQIEKDLDEGIYEKPDLSREKKLTNNTEGYQPGILHGANQGDSTPGFMPVFQDGFKSDGYQPGNLHEANLGNSIPGFMPMYNDKTLMERSIKSRIKDAQLPNEGKVRFIPPKNYHPSLPLRKGPNGYLDRFDNEWKKGPSRTHGEDFEWDVQLSERGKKQLGWTSRDGNHINVSQKGHITHK